MLVKWRIRIFILLTAMLPLFACSRAQIKRGPSNVISGKVIPGCEYADVKESPSPDGEIIAIVRDLACNDGGWSSTFETTVFLMHRDKPVPEDELPKSFVLMVPSDGSIKIELRWRTNRKLIIRMREKTVIDYQKYSEDKVEVLYEKYK